MYAWLRARNPHPFAGVNVPMMALSGVLLSGIGNGFVLWAQQGIPSGIAALIVAAVPVLVLIFDWAFFSKRAPTKQALFGIAVAIAGVVTIVMHTRTLSGNAHPLYVLAMFVATTGWSLGTLLQKRSANTGNGAQLHVRADAVRRSVPAADVDRHRRVVAIRSRSDFLCKASSRLLYLVVFGSIIGLNCYLWLLTRVPAPKVATYALVNPVVALVLGAAVLGERVTPLAIVAAVLVLFGVALIVFQDLPLVRALIARNRR